MKKKAKEEIEKRNKLAINEEGGGNAKEESKNSIELVNLEEEERREYESMTISLKKN